LFVSAPLNIFEQKENVKSVIAFAYFEKRREEREKRNMWESLQFMLVMITIPTAQF
jgi:hypothetical protein